MVLLGILLNVVIKKMARLSNVQSVSFAKQTIAK